MFFLRLAADIWILIKVVKEPLVHVLIINWNGMEHLDECFRSLLSSPYGNVRFVLIDNGSDDGSVEFVRDTFGKDSRVETVVSEENLGWSRGNNLGLERAIEAGAEYALLLNNDTWTDAQAIGALVERCESRPEIGALAPKMVLFDTPCVLNSVGLEMSIVGACWDRGLGRLDGPEWRGDDAVVGACGGACFLRVAALEKTGLLPTDFDIYLDDLDLCLRIWNAGYEIRSCPEAVVGHKFSATMGEGEQVRRKYYLNTRNRLQVLMRNVPVSRCLPVAMAYVVGEGRAVGRALLDGAYWKAGIHLRTWVDGLSYVGSAAQERRRRRRNGLGRCMFWHLVRKSPQFFPGIELPVKGWYGEVVENGSTVRPISGEAYFDCDGGRFRIRQRNLFPEIGPSRIEITQEKRILATLETLGSSETIIEAKAGRLVLSSKTIFRAEQTGAQVDLGGWIGIERVE